MMRYMMTTNASDEKIQEAVADSRSAFVRLPAVHVQNARH